tara:strand:+ start:156 stop:578 length:423 start_codon:yes stop_codon:yes gene_type:complete
MMFPTIHLNGTSGADLLSQTVDAMLALSDAIKALRAAGPNGRDYYVQQDVTAFAQAQQQHWDRIAKLEAVLADLVAISESIHAQMTPRTAPKTTIRAEWFADGTPATCTCGRAPDCDHVRNAQALGTVRGSVSAVWEEMK